MDRGCIATGEMECGGCQRVIRHEERYLILEEKEGERLRFCVDCCLNKGYASYLTDKGEEVLTFFPPAVDS